MESWIKYYVYKSTHKDRNMRMRVGVVVLATYRVA